MNSLLICYQLIHMLKYNIHKKFLNLTTKIQIRQFLSMIVYCYVPATFSLHRNLSISRESSCADYQLDLHCTYINSTHTCANDIPEETTGISNCRCHKNYHYNNDYIYRREKQENTIITSMVLKTAKYIIFQKYFS